MSSIRLVKRIHALVEVNVDYGVIRERFATQVVDFGKSSGLSGMRLPNEAITHVMVCDATAVDKTSHRYSYRIHPVSLTRPNSAAACLLWVRSTVILPNHVCLGAVMQPMGLLPYNTYFYAFSFSLFNISRLHMNQGRCGMDSLHNYLYFLCSSEYRDRGEYWELKTIYLA